jgi:hypothetical protein
MLNPFVTFMPFIEKASREDHLDTLNEDLRAYLQEAIIEDMYLADWLMKNLTETEYEGLIYGRSDSKMSITFTKHDINKVIYKLYFLMEDEVNDYRNRLLMRRKGRMGK